VPTLSAIIPATDSPPTLARVTAAIRAGERAPDELIVVGEPLGMGPGEARNRGAEQASGEILVFVDSDVVVHHDAISRIDAAFEADPDLVALFGSYDDTPSAPGNVSVVRNLLHHHVHQSSAGKATTFWGGLGAIRRDAFVAVGGFNEQWEREWRKRFGHHGVEDIELGIRLNAVGKRIVLDASVQGTHLKAWSLRKMASTDLLARGVPWTVLMLRAGTKPSGLNLGWRHRLSAASCVAIVAGIAARRPLAAVASLGALLALNRSFYGLLLRQRGAPLAAAGVGVHAVHHLMGVASVPIGIAVHLKDRYGTSTVTEWPPNSWAAENGRSNLRSGQQ